MNALRLLFDENLSPRLVLALADVFPASQHVEHAGLRGKADTEVWDYARSAACVLVSKDNDFRQLAFLRGAPPKVIWLRVGNASTAQIERLLRVNVDAIFSFAGEPDTALWVLEALPPDGCVAENAPSQ